MEPIMFSRKPQTNPEFMRVGLEAAARQGAVITERDREAMACRLRLGGDSFTYAVHKREEHAAVSVVSNVQLDEGPNPEIERWMVARNRHFRHGVWRLVGNPGALPYLIVVGKLTWPQFTVGNLVRAIGLLAAEVRQGDAQLVAAGLAEEVT
jgi:hypothetical protein